MKDALVDKMLTSYKLSRPAEAAKKVANDEKKP